MCCIHLRGGREEFLKLWDICHLDVLNPALNDPDLPIRLNPIGVEIGSIGMISNSGTGRA
jgi:hypothetical protein